MVYYFTSTTTTPPSQLYMGKDKFENEELVKHGHDNDVWFHVDKLSSAHVYLRMHTGQRWDNLPEALVTDCAQLTKANSIEGNKQRNITVIYTPWSNLRTGNNMNTGQVAFKNDRLVRRIHVPDRENPIVNRLNKTRVERHPDLAAERVSADKLARETAQKQQQKQQQHHHDTEQDATAAPQVISYDNIMKTRNMVSNSKVAARNEGRDVRDIEEDFM